MSPLSIEFLQSRGVPITQSLREWMSRVQYVARTRQSEADLRRYENWCLSAVEDAVHQGGVAAKDWSRQSPVMPANAPQRSLTILNPFNGTVCPQPYYGVPCGTVDYRGRLLEECSLRSPAELRPFLPQAFDAIDEQLRVRNVGSSGYAQIGFIQVIQVAEQLRLAYLQQPTLMYPQLTRLAPPPPPSASSAPRQERRHQDDMSRTKRPREDDGEPHRHTADEKPSAEVISFFVDLASSRISLAPLVAKGIARGTSTALERRYSRQEPVPEDIRPLSVLKKAFTFVQTKSQSMPDEGARYLAEQLKGMRQDLRVQNIQNSFAVAVYEASARACLAVGDLGDFNQCQAALKGLYKRFASATLRSDDGFTGEEEFTWYRMAYLAFCDQGETLAAELMISSDSLTPTMTLLCAAKVADDSSLVNQLVVGCPAPCMRQLVDMFLQKQRASWLNEVLGGIRGKLSTSMLLRAMAFLPPESSLEAALGKFHDAHMATSSHEGMERFLSSNEHLFIDASLERAASAFSELMKLVGVDALPADEVKQEIVEEILHSELCSRLRAARKNSKKKRSSPLARQEPRVWDSCVLVAAVQKYAEFLRTRRDAAGIQDD